MIKIDGLVHIYKTYRKFGGLKGALKDFFHRKYETNIALNHIQLQIEKGEVVGLLGPNGAGKTTLMKIISGIVEPSEGKVVVNGFNPYRKEKQFLRQIGMVLGQKSQLLWDLPPSDTFILLKNIYWIEDEVYKKRVSTLCSLLNISDLYHVPVRKLSLGERMKFELVAALLHEPSLLLLDEPTIGLDIHSQRAIHAFLQEVNERSNTTIILTSHYAKDIEALCQRLVILQQGIITYDGDLHFLYNETDKILLTIQTADDKSKEILQDKGFHCKFEHTFIKEIKENELQEVIKELIEESVHFDHISTGAVPLEDKLFDLFQKGE